MDWDKIDDYYCKDIIFTQMSELETVNQILLEKDEEIYKLKQKIRELERENRMYLEFLEHKEKQLMRSHSIVSKLKPANMNLRKQRIEHRAQINRLSDIILRIVDIIDVHNNEIDSIVDEIRDEIVSQK